MASNNLTTIKQFVHRLDSATSAERIDALQELQTLARSEPGVVGEQVLRKVFRILREQSTPEEYAEALDLTSRLLTNRDRSAASNNVNIILQDVENVELLLDLLEHEDLTVGIMTSQILTEIHNGNGEVLEKQIQQCPDGKCYSSLHYKQSNSDPPCFAF